jgi:NtrC-family two-component system sensor histidine kinase KinB
MKVKTKLRLGFGFLFIVMLLFGATALFYIRDISENSKAILKNNYESLSFAQEMRSVLDDNELPISQTTIEKFNDYLLRQEGNVTEPDENRRTHQIRTGLDYLSATTDVNKQKNAIRVIRRSLRNIEFINMQAIVRKDNNARASVNRATLFLGLVGTFTFLVLFSFSVNFPALLPTHCGNYWRGSVKLAKRIIVSASILSITMNLPK